MSQSKFWLAVSVAGCLGAPLAHADEVPMEDDTVTVVEDGETPEDVTHAISLPESASATAHERAAFGQGVADLAHDKGEMTGREFGEHVSEMARARDLGNDARADLQSDQRAEAGAGNAGERGRH